MSADYRRRTHIIVKGSASFIGGHLAERFLEEGHDVVVLDNFDPYYDIALKEYNVERARGKTIESNGSYELIQGNVRNIDLGQRTRRGCRPRISRGGIGRRADEHRELKEVECDERLEELQKQ